MRRQEPEAVTGHPEKPAELLRRKLLAAGFSTFPGDIGKFDDEPLKKEGLLSQVHQIERKFEQQDIGETLMSALINKYPKLLAARRQVFRWLCLGCRQNALRSQEIDRLKREQAEAHRKNYRLREEAMEGTFGLFVRGLSEGREVSSPAFQQEMERTRRAWRDAKQAKFEAALKEREHRRRRSGSTPPHPKAIDWTQHHTKQEFVDAFGEERIHVKRVREFLRTFVKGARRRGRGRNVPLEYPADAGLELFEEALTNWYTDPSRRKQMLFATLAYQASLPSALTAEGLRFKESLARLWKRYLLPEMESVLPGITAVVESTEGWCVFCQGCRGKANVTA